MLDALRMLGYSLRDTWDEFAILVMLNVIWGLAAFLPILPFFFMTNPFAVVAGSLFLGLPLPVASGALCYVANQVTRGKVATWTLFIAGVRRYWAKSFVVAAVNILALVVVFSNMRFYTLVVTAAWANVALSALLVAGIFWGMVQIYWFPMILELENEQVFEALRRAAALVIVWPGYSLSLGLIICLVAALCVLTTIPAFVLMASLLLLVCNHATRSRLAAARNEPYRPGDIEGP